MYNQSGGVVQRKSGIHGCLICLSIIMLITMIPLLISGGIIFGRDHSKVINYQRTTCTVTDSSYDTVSCIGYDRCFKPKWNVQYQIQSGTYSALIVGASTTILWVQGGHPVDHRVGSSGECYYNPQNFNEVQWDEPNDTVGRKLLISGGIFLVLTSVLCILSVFLIRQSRNVQTNCSYPQSFANPIRVVHSNEYNTVYGPK